MLSDRSIKTLVNKLTLELGYTEITEGTFDDVRFTVDDYSNAILEAEGLTPAVGGDHFRDVRQVVREIFEMDLED